VAPTLYARLVNSIPWDATPRPPHATGQWLAIKKDGNISYVFHLRNQILQHATMYRKEPNEQLSMLATHFRVPAEAREVRIVRTLGPRHTILDFNPTDDTSDEQKLWLWGNRTLAGRS
jgi:hypothetical protein